MALTITDDEITSNITTKTARRLEAGGWMVSGRTKIFDRNQAITAMTLAEVEAEHLQDNPRFAHLVLEWERELSKRPQL